MNNTKPSTSICAANNEYEDISDTELDTKEDSVQNKVCTKEDSVDSSEPELIIDYESDSYSDSDTESIIKEVNNKLSNTKIITTPLKRKRQDLSSSSTDVISYGSSSYSSYTSSEDENDKASACTTKNKNVASASASASASNATKNNDTAASANNTNYVEEPLIKFIKIYLSTLVDKNNIAEEPNKYINLLLKMHFTDKYFKILKNRIDDSVITVDNFPDVIQRIDAVVNDEIQKEINSRINRTL